MDKAYWEKYYRDHPEPSPPSAFALAMVDHLVKPGTLIDLGCGNGRDAVFFGLQVNLAVVAIDQCEAEIDRLASKYAQSSLQFVAQDFSAYRPSHKVDNVYSRWTMHAIDESAEDQTLQWVADTLTDGGRLVVEARSISDDLYGVGEAVGPHAFVTDHYRRFMDKERFISKLEKLGLAILHSIESRGLAKKEDDDPVIVRIVAER